MSWRSLILMAVANARKFLSPAFLAQLETCSSFRFNFLRARNQKLDDRASLFPVIFDAFLEAGEDGHGGPTQPANSSAHTKFAPSPISMH
jgi:hypothetical protein